MKILYIGDVMAESGILAVEKMLPKIVKNEAVDFVVAQAENVTDGKGMSIADYERLKTAGVCAFTGGNHTTARTELNALLEDVSKPVVGPANMTDCPGPGYKLVETPKGSVLVVSILGGIVGRQADIPTANPLTAIDEILARESHVDKIAVIVNFHGDFSSEKVVFGHYLDGRASMVVGDHWHVPTADSQIMPKGTAYVTDVGMCGSLDSSLGVAFAAIIPRWRDGVQTRNELETAGRMQFNALLADIDEKTGRAVDVRHIREVW
jgi:hypothetical protein